MSAEACRRNGYVSLMPMLKAAWARTRRFRRSRLVTLDDRLEQEGLTAHMARDLGLNDASLLYDSCRADREA